MSRDILNHGVHIANREVLLGSIPESAPTLQSQGYSIVATMESGITVTPPFILCISDMEGGTNPIADLEVYEYFADSNFLNKWRKVRNAVVKDEIIDYVPFPTIGARRFQVIVSAVSGAPTRIRLNFRAVSTEAVDLIRMIGEEFSAIPSTGGKITINSTHAERIGPLTINRPYQFFSDIICWHRRGDSSVVATSADVPIQAGPVYQHIPRSSSEQYISFLGDTTAGTVWYGQAF